MNVLGENQDLVVQFGVLWGMEMANKMDNKEAYEKLRSFDSQELFQMFQQWGQEYLHSEFDDTVDFFESKLVEVFSEKPSLDEKIADATKELVARNVQGEIKREKGEILR